MKNSMNEFIELSRMAGRGFAAVLAGAPRLHTQFTENCAIVLSGEPYLAMNVVIVGSDTDASQTLAETAELARRRGHPLLALLSPHVAAGLASNAESLGFISAGQMPLMVLRREIPQGIRRTCKIERATDRQMREDASALRAQDRYLVDSVRRTIGPSGTTEPTVEIFLGSRDGAPVSTVTITEAGATAGIWWMATATNCRRTGVGSSLLAQVINEYRLRGTSRFYLAANEIAKPLYIKLGFETIGSWTLWALDFQGG
jgi:GNAT superfamily N-acetyltransferase